MESIYYVLCWACHRKCEHCYEPRFKPYVRGALRGVVDEARAAFPKVISNLPDKLRYLDLSAPSKTTPRGYVARPGRIILAGGEVLVDPVREAVLYPPLEAIRDKYAGQGLRVIVQTTGDLVTPQIVEDLLVTWNRRTVHNVPGRVYAAPIDFRERVRWRVVDLWRH